MKEKLIINIITSNLDMGHNYEILVLFHDTNNNDFETLSFHVSCKNY